MGPRGFRVSLARTATKEDCTEVEFSVSEIIPCYRRAKHGTTFPPSCPEGRVIPLSGLYWGVPLDRIHNFMRILPNRVWLVRSTFHFVFLNMVGVSNPQRHRCTQTLIKSSPSSSPPPPSEWRNSAEPIISDFLNGTLRPPLPPKSMMQNGAFFSSRDFNIDFFLGGGGVGRFLFDVIPSGIVD